MWRIAAVGLLAFALRAGYVAQESRGPGELTGDSEQYHGFALNLAERGAYVDANGDRLFRMPGYPVFLAGVYRSLGVSVPAVQAVQCLLSALAAALLLLAVSRLYGEGWGLGAGIVAAGYFGMIEPCARIVSESLAASLLCAFIWAWVCLRGVRSRILAGGVLLGLTCLVRPDFLPFAGALCVLLPLLDKSFRWRHALMWLGVFAALWTPWLARNAAVFGRFIPGSTQGPAGLYMGLALPLTRLGDIEKTVYIPHTVDEKEQERRYWSMLGELLRKTPPVKIARAYLFNIASVFYPFLPEYDWTFMLLVPFWLWSLRLIRDGPEARPLWLLVGLYALVHAVAGGPVSRYRQPLSGPLIVLAAAGARDLGRRVGPRAWRWAASWAGANMLVWLFAVRIRSGVLALKDLVF